MTKGIIKIDNKYFFENEKYIPIPDLTEQFTNKDLNEFIKGLLKSKYFIG